MWRSIIILYYCHTVMALFCTEVFEMKVKWNWKMWLKFMLAVYATTVVNSFYLYQCKLFLSDDNSWTFTYSNDVTCTIDSKLMTMTRFLHCWGKPH